MYLVIHAILHLVDTIERTSFRTWKSIDERGNGGQDGDYNSFKRGMGGSKLHVRLVSWEFPYRNRDRKVSQTCDWGLRGQQGIWTVFASSSSLLLDQRHRLWPTLWSEQLHDSPLLETRLEANGVSKGSSCPRLQLPLHSMQYSRLLCVWYVYFENYLVRKGFTYNLTKLTSF